MPRLLLATTNKGKAAEYRDLLEGLGFELVTLDKAGISQEADESYNTFEENARHKAAFYAELGGLLTLADDSGLEVDALQGEPGVRSSRYAGDNATDSDRVDFLLNKVKDIPQQGRTARFRCVIAVARPDGPVETVEGICEGYIALEPMGTNGFGYDPIFLFRKYDKTMAELPMEIKNRISHRGRAAAKAKEVFLRMAKQK